MSKHVVGLVTVGALLAGTTIIGACGSDEDRLTAEEFTDQGNEICKTSNEAVEAADAEMSSNPDPSPEEITAYLEDDLIPSIQTAIDDFEDLNPPEDLEDDLDAFIEAAQAALDELEAGADDPEALFAGEDPFAEVNALATQLGLTTCAEDG